jgi:glycosyltransferase involved in cell wall biosynthesis
MKIGLEAKWLFRGPPSGRRVVRNLIRGLAGVARDDELHLFLDARDRRETLPVALPDEQCHYIWAGNNQLANLFVVPRVADRARLDAVVYQNFVPPRTSARHARLAFVHDVSFESHPAFFTRRERLYFSTLRYLTVRADRVCTVSNTERDRLVRLRYAHADRVDVVPNSVDERFAPRERLPRASTDALVERLGVAEPFVLYAGRLNARKNVAALVRAMAFVRTRTLPLVIAGAADATTSDLARIAADAGVAHRVRLLGPVSDDELRVLYAAATVFCFASLDEGFGLGPLEAMASGTPAIVSNLPVMMETCGDAAVYVDPSDPAAIASAIDGVVGDAGRRAALRCAGFARAAAFTEQGAAEHLLRSVHAAVRQPRARA